MNLSKQLLYVPVFFIISVSQANATPLLDSNLNSQTVYSGSGITMGADSKINGNGNIQAVVSVDLGASVTIGGNAFAGIDLTLGNSTIVNGDATAGTRALVIGAHAKVGGDAKAGTSVTVSATGSVDGNILEDSVTNFDANANKTQLEQAQATLFNMPTDITLSSTITGNTTLQPGVYYAPNHLTTTAGITLTLDGNNEPNFWVFNIKDYLAFGANLTIKLLNVTRNSTIIWNTGTYTTIGADSSFVGVVFADTYITTGANTSLIGIDDACGGLFTTNGVITLGASNTDSTVGSADCKAGALNHFNNSSPDYFMVSHDTRGIHCAAEPVSVTAKNADGSITTGFNGTITLDTQTGTGGWSLDTGSGNLVDTNPNDGLATYTFDAADNGVADFLLYYTEGTSTFDIDAYEGAVRDNDTEGNMTFSASGFTITASELSPHPSNDPIPSQIAGKDFNIYITAFGTMPDDDSCGIIETYTGSKNLTLTTTHVNPSSGTVLATGGGAITVNNGQTVISTKYKDAGMIRIGISEGTISGSSNNFVVKPHSYEIALSDGESGSDYEAINATDSVYNKAGVDFNITLTAKDFEGDTTPNYGNETSPETVDLSHTLAQPVDGDSGIFNSNLSKTGNGIYSGTANWSEVGIINLTTTVGDADYLGTGNVSTTLNNVGRFTPAKLSVTTIDNGSFMSTNRNGTENFTYVGQGFSYDPNQRPAFEVTAMNALPSATTTLNYTGDWGKLSADSIAFTGPSSDSSQDGKTASTLMVLIYTRDTAGFRDDANTANQPEAVNGIFNVTFTNDAFTYEKDNNSEISPFKPSVNLVITNVEDLDGISTGTFTLNPTGTEPIRFGRMRMYNANGSELSTLVMDYRLEYFDSNWVLHDDQDSLISAEHVTGSSSSSPVVISAQRIDADTPLGKFQITLSPPGEGNTGAYRVTTNLISSGLPWLQYDWDDDDNYDDNPRSTADYGKYKGNPAKVLILQTYQ
jgi:serine acetyltransferase